MALLEVRGLTVSFGGVLANDRIDLDVETGMIVGVIGPNGAGKTTLLDAITGFVPTNAGHVSFDSVELTTSSPAARARAGLARTFQSLELFEDLTVHDNLAVGAHRQRWWSLALDLVAPKRLAPADAAEVARILAALDLDALADAAPSALSHGQRKLVGVARALAARPKLLALDEPAAGLDTTESRRLGERLRGFLDGGPSILLIDHDMDLVLDVCDRVYVLDLGSVIAVGTPAEVRADPAVVAAYLGPQATNARREQPGG